MTNTTIKALLELQDLEFSPESRLALATNGSRIRKAIKDLRSQISSRVLIRYDARKRRYGAGSVVAVRSGYCTGCQVALSRRTRQRARMDMTECEHCARLLYNPNRHHRPFHIEVWAA